MKPLFTGNEWSFSLIEKVDQAIKKIATDELGLDPYPAQIEIISSDQMLELYSSTGLPMNYGHWSFGKRYLRDEYQYRKGMSGLAYEIVINSNPCIAYLMEENTMTMQALVIAHASYGHSDFFRNNYLFKQWTDASGILDYLSFARRFILECEQKYGHDEVEWTLDACHSLQDYGVDRYKRPRKLSLQDEITRAQDRSQQRQREAHYLYDTISPTATDDVEEEFESFPPEPQENILYFLEKHSPVLEQWQREIVRIVRKIAQYFYPQAQTKVMNEGWATFVHYYIMNRLWEKGQLTDGQYLEFIASHSGVVLQSRYDSPYYSGFNPYWLGFNMFQDIRRMCEHPSDEDREWFPDIAGRDWRSTLREAMVNYRDESFIRQFLSPNLIRKYHLFRVNDSEDTHYTVDFIQNERGYKKVRTALADMYTQSQRQPHIQVERADLRYSRTLYLTHKKYNKVELKDPQKVLDACEYLWGYQVKLDSVEDV